MNCKCGRNIPEERDCICKDALKHAKALYAGEVTLVDRWFGNLLEKIEDLGLLENTAIIFTSDHGTFLGEHGFIHKYNLLYEEIAHIPLIIRLPETHSSTHGRSNGFVQPPDLMPTILELANTKIPPVVQGKSIISLVRGGRSSERKIAVTSASLRNPTMSPCNKIFPFSIFPQINFSAIPTVGLFKAKETCKDKLSEQTIFLHIFTVYYINSCIYI